LRFHPSKLRARTIQDYGLSAARPARKCRPGGAKRPLGDGRDWGILHHQNRPFPVDIRLRRSLYTRSGAPSALRRDCAPLKLLTGTVNQHPTVSDVWSFDGSPVHRRAGTATVPGCLKSESEERETWTAESLRAASRGEAILYWSGFGRDFGGSRLRYIAEHLEFRAQARDEK